MKLSLAALILVLTGITAMATDTNAKEAKWYSGQVQHEGFPLYLRFPAKPDFDSLQKKYPNLLVVTHTFAKVTSSGAPEADYNESLAEFDHELINTFVPSVSGFCVLVETYRGRRNYYIYVPNNSPIEAIKQQFSTKYPQQKLNWNTRDDAGWKFIRRYSEEYHFYKKN